MRAVPANAMEKGFEVSADMLFRANTPIREGRQPEGLRMLGSQAVSAQHVGCCEAGGGTNLANRRCFRLASEPR